MNDKLHLIKKLSFFNSLDTHQLELLDSISKITSYAKNSVLYYENDTHEKIFFLISGLIKVYKIDKYENEIFLYYIYKDSMISELTTVSSDTIHCFCNAECMEESVILEVDFVKFKQEFLSKNILNNEFINEILSQMHQLHCVINRELVFDATAKVAFALANDLEMFNSHKRHEVSFMLHIQPETLSRVLNKLKRSSIIEIENSAIVILDKKMLGDIYKGSSHV